VQTHVVYGYSDFFTFQATNVPATVGYRLVVRNAATAGIGSSLVNVTTLADSDGDGLPDEWELANGFNTNDVSNASLDSDGDGMSNWQEYIAGTEPTNALSYLWVKQTNTPGVSSVFFPAISNKTYTVQFRDNLAGAPWSSLADIVARGSNRLEVISDPTWTTNRFYRLVTPWQP
jgi:hypothetical protein